MLHRQKDLLQGNALLAGNTNKYELDIKIQNNILKYGGTIK